VCHRLHEREEEMKSWKKYKRANKDTIVYKKVVLKIKPEERKY
jgi:hypothetical protein